jgi:hypothetical protein
MSVLRRMLKMRQTAAWLRGRRAELDPLSSADFGPAAQRSRFVRLCYKNWPFVSSGQQGGFPVERAALGACELSALHIDGEWQWLVRQEGRDVTEGPRRLLTTRDGKPKPWRSGCSRCCPVNCGTQMLINRRLD